MREIKFRAWDGQDTMIYFDFDSIKHDGLIDWNEKKYSDTGGGLYIANCEIMQYTGLQDKTGRDIFEGDIIQWINYTTNNGMKNITVIKYDDKDASFYIGSWYDRDFPDTSEEALIIGNIYENPELLDK